MARCGGMPGGEGQATRRDSQATGSGSGVGAFVPDRFTDLIRLVWILSTPTFSGGRSGPFYQHKFVGWRGMLHFICTNFYHGRILDFIYTTVSNSPVIAQ